MKMEDHTTRRSVLLCAALVVLLAVLRSTLLAGVIPPLHGPDEPAHFDYVQRIAEHGQMPEQAGECRHYSDELRALDVAAVINFAFKPWRPIPSPESLKLLDPAVPAHRATTGCGTAASYPPLYYATGALGYAAAGDQPLLNRIFAARMGSVFWGALTALSAFLAGLFFFRRLADALLLGVLAVLQPMLGFLSAVVNNDAALFAASSASFAAIAAAREPAHRRKALVALAAFAVVGVLSKTTYVLCLPIFFVFCVAALGPRRWQSWAQSAAAFSLSIACALAWTLLWPSGTGGVFSTPVMQMSFDRYVLDFVLDLERTRWLWVEMYWMTWGWADTRLPVDLVNVLLGLTVLCAVGWVLGWKRAQVEERAVVILGAASTLGLILVLYALEFLVVRRSGSTFIQGRYLLPLFAVHGVMLILGFRWLGQALRSRVSAPWALVGFLVFLNGTALFRALARFYA